MAMNNQLLMDTFMAWCMNSDLAAYLPSLSDTMKPLCSRLSLSKAQTHRIQEDITVNTTAPENFLLVLKVQTVKNSSFQEALWGGASINT